MIGLTNLIVDYYKKTGDILNLDAYLFSKTAVKKEIPQALAYSAKKTLEENGFYVGSESDKYLARLGVFLSGEFIVVDTKKEGNPTTLHGLGSLLASGDEKVIKAFRGATYKNGVKEGTYFLPRLDVEDFKVEDLGSSEFAINITSSKTTIPKSRFDTKDIVIIPLTAYVALCEVLHTLLKSGLFKVKLYRGTNAVDRVYTSDVAWTEQMFNTSIVSLLSRMSDDVLSSMNFLNHGIQVFDIRNTSDELSSTFIRPIDIIDIKPYTGSVSPPIRTKTECYIHISNIIRSETFSLFELKELAAYLGFIDTDLSFFNKEDIISRVLSELSKLKGFELYHILVERLKIQPSTITKFDYGFNARVDLDSFYKNVYQGVVKVVSISNSGSPYIKFVTKDPVILADTGEVFLESSKPAERLTLATRKIEGRTLQVKTFKKLLLNLGVMDGRYIDIDRLESLSDDAEVQGSYLVENFLKPAIQLAVEEDELIKAEKAKRDTNPDLLFANNPLALDKGSYFVTLNRNKIISLEINTL
jgi:hypothetical protein